MSVRSPSRSPAGASGPQGPAGPAGPQGPTGAQGPRGDTGPQGPTGLTGAQGPQGGKGDVGATGPKGDTGPAGSQGAAGPKGDTGAQGATGPQGAQGVAGPSGPAGSTLLGTFTLSENALIAIAAGTRRLSVTLPASYGVAVGQNLICIPQSVPAGYATHDVTVTAANTISVGLTAPLLAIGASYTITCRLVRLNT